MSMFRFLFASMLVFSAFVFCRTASATDSCSATAVVQPAIDAAAAAASCNADGVYITPALLADGMVQKCAAKTDKKSCERCLLTESISRSILARLLVQSDLLPKGATVVTIEEIYKRRAQFCK